MRWLAAARHRGLDSTVGVLCLLVQIPVWLPDEDMRIAIDWVRP